MNFHDKLGTGSRTRHVSVFTSRPSPQIQLREFIDTNSQDLYPSRRARIFDLNANLHCSIIGTCLTMAEMRHVLVKLEVASARTATDHEIHAQGVLLAARNDAGGKFLNKALDRKHRGSIARFTKAATSADVMSMWRACVQEGDIPGAYWAAITHPTVSDAEIRGIFGEVHMLSHLVGSANRADIRRLRELEEQNAELTAKVDRQQVSLKEAVVTRDAIIAGLQRSLAASSSAPSASYSAEAKPTQEGRCPDVVDALNARLAALTRRCDRLKQKAESAAAQLEEATRQRLALEARERSLLREIEALERHLTGTDEASSADDGVSEITGKGVLYVGGHPHQIAQLRAATEVLGATFLHHDGGIEERCSVIVALVSRADLVLFPVDCVSHAAVVAIKKACRQMGKRYRALRTSGRSSLLAALNEGPLTDAVGSAAADAEAAA